MENNADTTANGPNATLVIANAATGVSEFTLQSRTQYFIGRSPACDIVIDLPVVSRRHAQISYHDGAFFVTDLDSRNGTYVNGKRLQPQEEVSLTHEDWIGFADDQVTLYFHESSGSGALGFDRTTSHTDLTLDPVLKQVSVRGNQMSPSLPREQFDVLTVLYESRGSAVRNQELADGLFPQGSDEVNVNEEVERCIRQLRIRMELSPSNPQLIVTLLGYGYILVGPAKDDELSQRRTMSARLHDQPPEEAPG